MRRVASGSGPVGTTISLEEENDSGISGEVAVSADAESDASIEVFLRWPEKFEIFVRRLPPGPPPFLPGWASSTYKVDFDGRREYQWTYPLRLPTAGFYYATITSVSDTGVSSSAESTAPLIIVITPSPPTDLAYASGDASSGILLTFTPPGTAVSRYLLYLQKIGESQVDLSTPIRSANWGDTSITIPPDALTGYPGKLKAILRSNDDIGGEEMNVDFLEIELDASGEVVADRPNHATFDGLIKVTGGRTITAPVAQNTLGELVPAATSKLYHRTPDGNYDWENPDDSRSLSSFGNHRKATHSYTFPSNGRFFVTARTATAGGVLSSEAEANLHEAEIFVSAAVVDATEDIELEAI
jgi:hypothetical protein